jgi:hypothetical protein
MDKETVIVSIDSLGTLESLYLKTIHDRTSFNRECSLSDIQKTVEKGND